MMKQRLQEYKSSIKVFDKINPNYSKDSLSPIRHRNLGLEKSTLTAKSGPNIELINQYSAKKHSRFKSPTALKYSPSKDMTSLNNMQADDPATIANLYTTPYSKPTNLE